MAGTLPGVKRRALSRVAIAIAVVEILLGSTLLGYRWVASSTGVSQQQALERFRTDGGPGGDVTPRGLPEGPILTPSPVPTPSPTPTPSGRRRRATPSPAPTPPPRAQPSYSQAPPEAGVYTYRTQGWEEGASIRRDLPETSQRIVRHAGPRTWSNEHIYSNEHEERFDITVTEQGLFSSYTNTEIAFGPFSTDHTLLMDPSMRVGVIPLRLDQRWQGEWSGPTSGSYQGRTVEHTTLVIGGEALEVWGVQLDITLRGEINGTVRSKVWISPRLRMPVKEFYDQQASTARGSYRGTWTITLTDIAPKR
jgi:hypothetical protein